MPPWMFLLCGGLPTLRGTVGDFLFFCFFVRCDELSDFPPSRLKVQHIPDCTGQYDFNLFSQAGSTDRHNLVWNSSPTSTWDRQCLLVDIPEGGSRVAAVFFVSHMCSPSKHLSLTPAITFLRCHIFQGHRTRGTLMVHIALSQLKKQNVKGSGRRHSLANRSVDSAEANQSVFVTLWGRLHRAESKCRIKCERHTKTTLKNMRRRRVVTPPRLAARNDKGRKME